LDFHKSRKIRLLEKQGYFIMSKVLEEFDDEDSAYSAEAKWEKFFINNGNNLSNMIKCGFKSIGSGSDHPSFNFEIRKHSKKIINLYAKDFWPIQKICRHYKLSQKTVKKILFQEANIKQRSKSLRNPVWKHQEDIINQKNDLSSYKIAKKYKCSPGIILIILKKNNIKIKNSHPRVKSSKAWLFKDKIVKEFLSGKSKKDLSKKYKCDIKCTLNPILEEAVLT